MRRGRKSSIIVAPLLRSCVNHSLWSSCSLLVKTSQEQSLARCHLGWQFISPRVSRCSKAAWNKPIIERLSHRYRFCSKSTVLWTNYVAFFNQLESRIKSSTKISHKQKRTIKENTLRSACGGGGYLYAVLSHNRAII